jgi:hypothetical protein
MFTDFITGERKSGKPKLIDYVGKQFGKLTVLDNDEVKTENIEFGRLNVNAVT